MIAITEPEFEKLVDSIVQRRLGSDLPYLHAETMEGQKAREREITADVEDQLTNQFEVV